MQITKKMGMEVRRLRLIKSMSQVDLSAKAGISTNTLSLIESGQGNPNKTTLKCLVDALGVTLDELAGK